MLFQSATFIWGFLIPVLVLFYAAARWGGPRWALTVLVLASLVFYGWSHPADLLVLLGSITTNYWLAGRVMLGRNRPAGRRWLVAGVTLNLCLLGWFKYAGFLSTTVQALTGWNWGLHAVLLPLGISFFTFQKIAYLVDVSRGRVETQRWSDFALFVTFFPQLIAGPIVHHSEFFPQIRGGEFARWRGERMAGGVGIFVLGIGKKQLLADPLGQGADGMFGQLAAAQRVGALEGWLGILQYAFQIYFDFSAYCDMAIGLGLMFGLTLPENFAAPYRATSMIEFWRRWHMTLSRFLRDYLYLPLGGNAGGQLKQARNLFVTMLLGGLWHGAAWTFAVWGAIHGVALAVNHGWRKLGWRCPAPLGWMLTFVTVVGAWVFFRAGDFASAGRGLRALSGVEGFWPTGFADGIAWLRGLQPAAGYREMYDLFHFLGAPGRVGATGLEWRQLLLNDTAFEVYRLVVAFSLILAGTPAVRWLWDPAEGKARFSATKAWAVGAVAVMAMVQSFSAVPSTFIYFRF